MPTAVILDGNQKIEASSAKHKADVDQKGSWSVDGEPTLTTGTKVSVGGKKVLLEVAAKWKYTGGSVTAPNGVVTPVGPFPDQATLKAGATKLTDAGQGILIDGDEAAGSMDSGNKITVSASQALLKTD
jgi:hypothetical protein